MNYTYLVTIPNRLFHPEKDPRTSLLITVHSLAEARRVWPRVKGKRVWRLHH